MNYLPPFRPKLAEKGHNLLKFGIPNISNVLIPI